MAKSKNEMWLIRYLDKQTNQQVTELFNSDTDAYSAAMENAGMKVGQVVEVYKRIDTFTAEVVVKRNRPEKVETPPKRTRKARQAVKPAPSTSDPEKAICTSCALLLNCDIKANLNVDNTCDSHIDKA